MNKPMNVWEFLDRNVGMIIILAVLLAVVVTEMVIR